MESDSDPESNEENIEHSHTAELEEGLECESSSEDEETDDDHCLAVDQHHRGNQIPLQSSAGDDSESSDDQETTRLKQLLPSTSRKYAEKRKGDSSTSEYPRKKKRRAAQDASRSTEEHDVTGSELQLYSQPPGTSSGISPMGGTVATGTRYVTNYFSDKQTKDFLLNVASSGCDTTIDTRDRRKVRIQLNQTVIKDSAVNIGGKTFINPAGKKQKKQPRKQSTPSPAHKLRQTTERHIEEWTRGMVHTAATQSVLDPILQGKTWVTVTGSPGEGKTTAAYLTLKKLHTMGRQVYEIRTPDDYYTVKDTKGPVLMFNDIFGSNQFSQDNLERWRLVFNDILDMKEHRELKNLSCENRDSKLLKQKKSVCVILVSRSTVLHSLQCHLGRFKDLMCESVVNLTHDIKGSSQERLDIWKYHAEKYNVSIDEKTVMDVCTMSPTHGFPHCCRLFASMYSQGKHMKMKKFFSEPIEFLNQTMESLLADSTTGSLLRKMLKRDGCLKLDSIRDDEIRYQYKAVAERLKGTYLSEGTDGIKFHHPSVYDSVAFVVCTCDPLFVIKYCSLSFLNERIRFQVPGPEEDNSLATLLIDSQYIDAYTERLKTELADDNISQVLSHVFFHDQRLTEKFMKTIQLDSQFTSESDFIQDFIHKKDKKTNHSFLFYSTNSGSDKLLRYICCHVQLSEEEQSDALFGICEHSSVSSF